MVFNLPPILFFFIFFPDGEKKRIFDSPIFLTTFGLTPLSALLKGQKNMPQLSRVRVGSRKAAVGREIRPRPTAAPGLSGMDVQRGLIKK